jgi:5-methylthioadenosine/S-adenosylhomocysteine deaminase
MILTARFLLTSPSEPFLRDHALRLRGSVIEALAPRPQLQPGPGEEVLDLGEAVLLPGLCLAHTHLDYGAYRGHGDGLDFLPWVRSLAQRKREQQGLDEFRRGARLSCLELVAAGVTGVGENTDPGIAAAEALVESGLKAICFQEEFRLGPGDLEQAIQDYRGKLDRLVNQTRGTRVSVGVSPHSPYMVPPGLFQALTDEARLRGMGISVHVAECQAEVDLFRSGSGPLAALLRQSERTPSPRKVSPYQHVAAPGWLDGHPQALVVHGVKLESEDLTDLAAREGCWLVHCPRSNSRLGEGIAPLSEALEAGVRVCLGSDGACSADRLDPFEEMRAALWLARARLGQADALSAPQAMELCLAGHQALGFGPGCLHEGAPADLCALSLESLGLTPAPRNATELVLQAAASDVCATLVEGEVLFLRGDFLRVKAHEILREVREAQKDRHTPVLT